MKYPEFDELLQSIEDALDIWTGVERDEDPPSAVYHATLDGKEYVVIVQGLDLPAAIEREEEEEE